MQTYIIKVVFSNSSIPAASLGPMLFAVLLLRLLIMSLQDVETKSIAAALPAFQFWTSLCIASRLHCVQAITSAMLKFFPGQQGH